jgi:hypothetical protein
MWVSGQRHAPAALYSQERNPVTPWKGGSVGVRAGLDTEARENILCLLKEQRLQTNDTPAPSSEGTPQETQTVTVRPVILVKYDHEPQKGLDTKTDWLTDRQL